MENSDPTKVGFNYFNSSLVNRGTPANKPRLNIEKLDYPKTEDVYTQAQEKKINSSKYLTSVREKLEEISGLLNFEMKGQPTLTFRLMQQQIML